MDMQGIKRIKARMEEERESLEESAKGIAGGHKKLEEELGDLNSHSTFGKNLLKYLGNPDALYPFSDETNWVGTGNVLERDKFWLYHIKALTFEEKAPRREAMENILGTFRGLDYLSFIYLILGNRSGVNFYFGVAQNLTAEEQEKLSMRDLGEDMLGPAIKGNFRGCDIEEVPAEEQDRILTKLRDSGWQAGILTGVPGTDEENESFQGVDRLADVMAGEEFGFMVIARPYRDEEISQLESELFRLADNLSPLARRTLQENKSFSRNSSRNQNTSDSLNMQESESLSHANNDTDSSDSRKDSSNQQQSTLSESAGSQYSTRVSASKNPSSTESHGNSGEKNGSEQSQRSYVYSQSLSEGKNVSHSHMEGRTTNESQSGSMSTNLAKSVGESAGESVLLTRQMEYQAKEATEWLRYIEEVLLRRLDYGRGKGLFLSCGYLFAKVPATLKRLANTAISLYSGPKGNRASLRFHELSGENDCLKALQNMQIPAAQRNTQYDTAPAAVLSRLERMHSSFAGSWLSAHELGILTALPQKEIPGLALREEVEFGMNMPTVGEENRIFLGHLVQDGTERKDLSAYLDAEAFDKHIFVTGVTGSGKTTTCKKLLLEWDKPFLVIEPAKTEYRSLKEKCPDLVFFTLGKQDIAPFFLNPFELFQGEAITARADMIKASLEAAFDMEAAIPQIMETAVYRAYKEKGWDIHTNEWLGEDGEVKDHFAEGSYAFPTMSDFWQAVKKVVQEEGFGERLQDEYMGSLKARIESLLVGAKGMMLDNSRSLDFYDLVNRKVVIELEEIKNGGEKSLLMGFILTNLLQAVQKRHREDPDFRHITLVEEAHRLLSRYVPGDSMNKKQGVEVFADMLAEVRKYGESLIIVDQIPDKMTPEVLKNTNTKIVHKLFARDDEDTIGDTMALSDEQKEFLSKLPTGSAIVFSQGWNKAVQVQIREKENQEEEPEISKAVEIPEEVIHEAAIEYYAEPEVIKRGVLRGLEQMGELDEGVKKKVVEEYLWLMRGGKRALELCREILRLANVKEKQFKSLQSNLIRLARHSSLEEPLASEVWLTYLYSNCYEDSREERKKILFECLRKMVQEPDCSMMVWHDNMENLQFAQKDEEME